METRDAMRRRARFALEVLEKREAPASLGIASAFGTVYQNTAFSGPSSTSTAYAFGIGISSMGAPAAACAFSGAISSQPLSVVDRADSLLLNAGEQLGSNLNAIRELRPSYCRYVHW